ncbi:MULTISPECIES: putative ABC transporter permease [Caproicibacterium]|uniref:Uncharacterized protein n=1 Tax=Caproicibacterium argilliputei TaxID=3030016 RepID=A0AA97DA30_9FIRM|nr:hypothetical protein [Caproicibacterium argilliputei]WOC32544.1 hypothetical protein PXC00_01355 [Caproicibacterium argilliputei]
METVRTAGAGRLVAAQPAAAQQSMALEHLGMWLMGGGFYCLLEVAWRGWTHWTMFLAGGTLFLLIGVERGKHRQSWSLVTQSILAGMTITVGEFVAGCVVNLGLQMHVWDYSDEPYNLWGQVSLLASLGWCVVGMAAVLLYDTLAWLLFGEERPHYKLL